ncbi:PhoPQ-activated pathogenicity-related family protein [Aquiflexum sp. TKW24L]|uniref:PhoPQ-activated pathogenicity-related family protein n=1 Tax=Aquiflexum sp. TKW24L TaxID=2942212 RepID=UPI0020BF34F6|nr:PhoPQ-activated pathogenicity-related family protein [Aquiflexum sp. TKW24L]MCL6260229.1 PhoPQ-activated pathogenicity-related family protein [Aquiflexum sp. TKW24L]
MKHYFNLLIFRVLTLAILLLACWSCQTKQEETETSPQKSNTLLKDYVHAPDSTFRYEIIHSSQGEGYDYHVIKMYSQHWLTKDIVDEIEWWHYVSVVIPKETPFETGMMYIGGGSKNSKMPEDPDQMILAAALQTNSIVAKIHNIPFQPLVFANDTFGERYEDAIIAYGWRKFLEGGAKDEDAYWLSRLPMTKAVKLAMDVVTEVAQKQQNKVVDKYVVAGASKRGWTTWTTAAVDDRVVAIVPIVIDLLNIIPSFQHHWRNYGEWSPAVEDYKREGIMEWQGSKEYDRLLEITEPFSYLEEYDIPKLLINATGDEFFLPDSWKFYWDSLPGEKHVQYVPNYGHDLSESDALPNMIAFYHSILNETPRPKYEWKIDGDKILITTDPNQKPTSIKLWTAANEEGRDFRIYVLGPKWTSSEILVNESGRYEVQMKVPQKGFQAYFVEITYPGEAPIKVTTGVDVLPRTYPFDPYVSKDPKGTME